MGIKPQSDIDLINWVGFNGTTPEYTANSYMIYHLPILIFQLLSHHTVDILWIFKPPFNTIEVPRSNHIQNFSWHHEYVTVSVWLLGVGCATNNLHLSLYSYYLYTYSFWFYIFIFLSPYKVFQYKSIQWFSIQFPFDKIFNIQVLSVWFRVLGFKMV